MTALLCGYGVGTMAEVEVKNACMECGDGEGDYRCNDCESHMKTCQLCQTDVDTRHIPTGKCIGCDQFICEECFIPVYFMGEDKLCVLCAEEPVQDTCCQHCDGDYDPKCTRLEWMRSDYNLYCSDKCDHADNAPACVTWTDDKYNQISTDKIEELCEECEKKYKAFMETVSG